MLFYSKSTNFTEWCTLVKQYDTQHQLRDEVLSKAWEALEAGAFIIAVSGKMAVGKDSVAPEISNNLNTANKVIETLAFAGPLKREVTDILRKSYSEGNTENILQSLKMSEELIPQGAKIIADVLEYYENKGIETASEISAYHRAPPIRTLLQWWGTDFRRNTVDEKYWVKLTVLDIVRTLSEGNSVSMVDIRFPDEADSILDVGGLVVRIDVRPEVQEERLLKRDGITMSEEQRMHPSETALDDYPNFLVRLDTSDLSLKETTSEFNKEIAKKF